MRIFPAMPVPARKSYRDQFSTDTSDSLPTEGDSYKDRTAAGAEGDQSAVAREEERTASGGAEGASATEGTAKKETEGEGSTDGTAPKEEPETKIAESPRGKSRSRSSASSLPRQDSRYTLRNVPKLNQVNVLYFCGIEGIFGMII